MKDLILITHANIGGAMLPTVDGRYIHGRLGIDTKFADWMPRRNGELELVENVDYRLLKNEKPENSGYQTRIDYPSGPPRGFPPDRA